VVWIVLSCFFDSEPRVLLLTKWLSPSHPSPFAPKVPEDILGNLRAARQTANDMIAQSSTTPSFNDMVDILQSKRDILTSLDPTFVLELNFLATAGLQSLEKKLHKAIFKILPSSSRRVGLQQALGALGDVQGG